MTEDGNLLMTLATVRAKRLAGKMDEARAIFDRLTVDDFPASFDAHNTIGIAMDPRAFLFYANLDWTDRHYGDEFIDGALLWLWNNDEAAA